MRIHVVSPWYPDYAARYAGIFVEKQVQGLERAGQTLSVEVPQLFPAPPGPVADEVVAAMSALAGRDTQAMYSTDGFVTRVPAPVPGRSGDLGRGEAFARSLGLKRQFLPVAADVTHAHLGLPTGWALLQLGDSPLVVTEHQSTLSRVFADPAASAAYRDTVERADAFVCVSASLRSQILAALGADLEPQIEVVPNAVDLVDIPFRERDEFGCRSWVYVGTVAQHKGIELLLRSFHRYRSDVDGSAVLTIVGDGPHQGWVERFVGVKALRDAVTIVGQVPHREIGGYLGAADLMVHLSPSETFGIASLEGIGAGLPVISLQNGGADTAWGDMETECGCLLEVDAGPDAVAEAISELRSNPERLNPAAGRSMVEERFGSEVVCEQLLGIYRRVQR